MSENFEIILKVASYQAYNLRQSFVMLQASNVLHIAERLVFFHIYHNCRKTSTTSFLGRTIRSGIDFCKFRTLPADLWSLGGALFPLAVRFARNRRIMVLMDRGVDFIIQSEQIPTAESVIRLTDEEPQQDGLFRLAVHWNLYGAEIPKIRDFSCRVDKYLRQEKIATLEIDERLLRGDPSILEQFGDFYHQVGGMCIGGSASSGVVDSDCRVWGTANVYVAGASVFPTSSHANITLAALALTARLASFLETL